jgi:SNF2 family DNA or RNA helicase
VSFELARHGALQCPEEKLKNAHQERLSSHTALLETMATALERGNRVCLFAMHTSVLAVAASVLAASDLGVKVVFYTGAVSTRTRAENLEYFRTTSDRVVLLLTIAAGGIGLHIGNGANQVVFWGSCGFTPASRDQAIRRLLRYGQESKVDVYDVYASNTVEDGIRSIHTVKSAVTSAVVDRDLGPLQEVGGDRLLRIVDRLCLVDRDTGNALPAAESEEDCTLPPSKRPALEKCAFVS